VSEEQILLDSMSISTQLFEACDGSNGLKVPLAHALYNTELLGKTELLYKTEFFAPPPSRSANALHN
jgi:hypothetical protein